MTLLVAGRANKQIAAQAALSERTVKVHRAQIMQKMRAKSLKWRTGWALLRGLLKHRPDQAATGLRRGPHGISTTIMATNVVPLSSRSNAIDGKPRPANEPSRAIKHWHWLQRGGMVTSNQSQHSSPQTVGTAPGTGMPPEGLEPPTPSLRGR
jgi:hypothetical protein